MNPPDHSHHQARMTLNTNTGVSVGIIVLMFGGFWAVMNGIGGMRTEITLTQTKIEATKMELNGKIDKIEAKVVSLEANKDSVTRFEFLKWAVHLQQVNSDAKKLQTEGIKVPELEVTK